MKILWDLTILLVKSFGMDCECLPRFYLSAFFSPISRSYPLPRAAHKIQHFDSVEAFLHYLFYPLPIYFLPDLTEQWRCRKDHLGISARAITKTLGGARADVLMFNDSPFSQYAYTGHLNGPGTFELIGSGSTMPAGQMQPNTMAERERELEREASFTRTLALMLDSPFLATRGVSVPELHRKLLDLATPAARVSLPPPEAPPTSPSSSSLLSSSVPSAHAGTGLLPGSPHRHNRHFSSSSSSRIVAHARKPSRLPAYPVYCQIAQAALVERDVRPNIVLSRLDTALVAQSSHAKSLGGQQPGVKLEFRLARHFLDVRRWKEWILRAPTEVQGVLVEACVSGG